MEAAASQFEYGARCRDAFAAGRRARDLVLALGDRLTPMIVTSADPVERERVHGIITGETRRVCEDMANADGYTTAGN